MKSEYCLVFVLSVFVFVQADKFLNEKPSFLKSCRLTDSNLNKCFAALLQSIFVEWKNGVPGLTSVGNLDPLLVSRIKIAQDDSRALSLKMILTNCLVSGTSKAIIKNAKLDPKTWELSGKLLLPKLDMNSDYLVKGHVLALALNGGGKSEFSTENTLISLQILLKLRDDGDLTFIEIDSLKCKIDDIGGFHMHVDNLFNGQKELEDAANLIFNENWRSLFESLKPAIERTIEAILGDRLTKIFHYVPGRYFIEDVPKASELYG